MLRRLATMLATMLAVLVGAELAVRVLAHDLPEPVTWYHEIAQAKAEQMEGRQEPVDFVFAGTSQTYHGIDPDPIDTRLGSRSYNAGIPAGIPTVQRRWLFDAVLPNLEVDTVVWSLSSVDLNARRPQQMESVYESALVTRTGLLPAADRWLSERLALFRHRRTLADPQAWSNDDDPLEEARRILLSSGKRIEGSPDLSERERRRVRRIVGEFEVGGHMSDAVRDTVTELQRRGIDVVLVWLPEAPRFVELLPDAAVHDEARAEARRLAAELGVPLLDVSDGFGDDDFIDYRHLGDSAAQELSARLATMLPRPD